LKGYLFSTYIYLQVAFLLKYVVLPQKVVATKEKGKPALFFQTTVKIVADETVSFQLELFFSVFWCLVMLK
jgi:hypothetical protein